jgi:DNA-binding response OmpR family regulator
MDEKKIMVVEDDVEILMLLKRGLEKEGFLLRCFLRGQEALGQVKAFGPHLILLDWTLPDIEGMEVLAKLKVDTETEKIPIIFVTGHTIMADIEKAFRVGVDDYVCKPFEFGQLLKKIKKILKME